VALFWFWFVIAPSSFGHGRFVGTVSQLDERYCHVDPSFAKQVENVFAGRRPGADSGRAVTSRRLNRTATIRFELFEDTCVRRKFFDCLFPLAQIARARSRARGPEVAWTCDCSFFSFYIEPPFRVTDGLAFC